MRWKWVKAESNSPFLRRLVLFLFCQTIVLFIIRVSSFVARYVNFFQWHGLTRKTGSDRDLYRKQEVTWAWTENTKWQGLTHKTGSDVGLHRKQEVTWASTENRKRQGKLQSTYKLWNHKSVSNINNTSALKIKTRSSYELQLGSDGWRDLEKHLCLIVILCSACLLLKVMNQPC